MINVGQSQQFDLLISMNQTIILMSTEEVRSHFKYCAFLSTCLDYCNESTLALTRPPLHFYSPKYGCIFLSHHPHSGLLFHAHFKAQGFKSHENQPPLASEAVVPKLWDHIIILILKLPHSINLFLF